MQGKTVVDGWAGVEMQKNVRNLKMVPTNQPGKV